MMKHIKKWQERITTAEAKYITHQLNARDAEIAELRAALAATQSAVEAVKGLGRITNEDNGYLTLQFVDEDSALEFMRSIAPSVEVDSMPNVDKPTHPAVVGVPNANEVILALRRALTSAEVPKGEDRAKIIGHFCNEYNALLLTPSPQPVAQGVDAEMRDALSNLLNRYVRLANSGDAGNWNPEEEPEVIAARAALTKDKKS
ncbi:hypothetical protein [Massilia sp. TS11]|uniref:hypothetical protein n=1 Tax=Massilia sp. TS11 TaxID=2908003 RepID=UPI001EDC8170|nr:hypothetical protein [Massilia sp. TS11]MCG2586544.1 hypothetical protein [Massilia sp. TS11]